MESLDCIVIPIVKSRFSSSDVCLSESVEAYPALADCPILLIRKSSSGRNDHAWLTRKSPQWRDRASSTHDVPNYRGHRHIVAYHPKCSGLMNPPAKCRDYRCSIEKVHCPRAG